MIRVAGAQSFTWSTSEQVWPFEKDINGNTLYAKQLNCGNMPNTGTLYYPHGLTDPTKIHNLQIYADYSTTWINLPFPYETWAPGVSHEVCVSADTSNIVIITWSSNWISYSAKARIIYRK